MKKIYQYLFGLVLFFCLGGGALNAQCPPNATVVENLVICSGESVVVVTDNVCDLDIAQACPIDPAPMAYDVYYYDDGLCNPDSYTLPAGYPYNDPAYDAFGFPPAPNLSLIAFGDVGACTGTFPATFPGVFNSTCAPVDVTVVVMAFEGVTTVAGVGQCLNLGYDFCAIPQSFTVTVLPFYDISQFIDYSGACGDQNYVIGIDDACNANANGDGDIAAPTLGQIDDCGGPDGTPEFDDPEVCVSFTATLDANALVPANPACVTTLPYVSPQDLNGDFFWDESEILAAAGLTAPTTGSSCYAFYERGYTPTADCLPPLLPPTLDYALTTPAVCSGGNALIAAGGTCAGYEGVIEAAGDPDFVDAVGDCVSWDLDFFISNDAANALGIDCQDVSALMLQPGAPAYAFGDAFADIIAQGYTYVGTFNNCSQAVITMPFNTTCAPVDIDIYALSWNWSIEQDLVPGDLICNLGGYDPAVPPTTFTVSVLPFYTLQATADYTGACGNYYTGLGLDCNGDGTMFTPEALDGDDCGGENTATPDFQAGEACINFTATADLSGITPANPACYVVAPLSSDQDVDNDGDWDGVDIASLMGFPEDPVAEGCYGLIDTYPATTTCLQPLSLPTCDYLPVEACSGSTAMLSAGPACDGYMGVTDNDGDGFISPPNDCVSWDADVYVSSTLDPLTGLPTSPGLPTIMTPVTSAADVAAQGYTYIGTFNECMAGSIGAYNNMTCAPLAFEVYVISWNYSYSYDEVPGDLICNLGGYTPDGPSCAVSVTIWPAPFAAVETPGTCDGTMSSVVINSAGGTECATGAATTTPTTPTDCGMTATDMFAYSFTAADLGLSTAPTACQQAIMGQIDVVCSSISCCDIMDPVNTPATVCAGTQGTLTSVGDANCQTLTWYSDAAGTISVATGGSYAPTDIAPGTYTYYTQCFNAEGATCTSNLVPVDYIINPLPDAVFTCPVLDCTNPANQSLDLNPLDNNGVAGATGVWSGTGAALVTGGSTPGDLAAIDPSLGTAGTTYTLVYTVTTTDGCESEAMCMFTLPVIPDSPIGTPDAVCEGVQGTLLASCATGETLNWYSDMDATIMVGTGSTYSPTDVVSGIYTYYAQCVSTDGCVSEVTPVEYTINMEGTADLIVPTLSCTGEDLNLNPMPTGGTYSGSGAAFVDTATDMIVANYQNLMVEGTVYTLTYTVTGAGGCDGETTINFSFEIDCAADAGRFDEDE